jgi:hypothetical protein
MRERDAEPGPSPVGWGLTTQPAWGGRGTSVGRAWSWYQMDRDQLLILPLIHTGFPRKLVNSLPPFSHGGTGGTGSVRQDEVLLQ